jgi:hypothetical protein
VNELLGILATIAALAFLTAPIWYPLWCADRAARAWVDLQARPTEKDDEPDDPSW